MARTTLPRPSHSLQPRPDHWAVSVFRNGANILTIESNSLSGRDLSPEDEQIIRECARHLLAFLGDPPATPDLLAALRMCRAIIGSGSRGARLRVEPEAIARADAAIAKAERAELQTRSPR